MKTYIALTSIVSGLDKIISDNAYDPKYLLSDHKLPATAISNIVPVRANRLAYFLEDLALELNSPDLWQSLVNNQSPETLELLGIGVISSKTVKDALTFMSKYCHYLFENLQIKLEIKSNCFWILFELPILRNTSSQITCLGMSQIQMILGNLLPAYAKPIAIYFRGEFSEEVVSFYNAPVRFESNFNALVYSNEYLDMPTVNFNSELLQSVTTNVEDQLNSEFNSRIERVINILLDTNPKQLNIELVSQFIGVRPRTIQLRLSKDDISFQTVLDSCRLKKAISLLKSTDLSLTDICQILGFSDSSAFSRWFKHCMDMTASDWRRERQERIY